MDVAITPESLSVNMSSYAMAKMSGDLYYASQNYTPDHFPFINFFLYCASIELALKAAILSKNCTKEIKDDLRNLGHNLIAAHSLYADRISLSLFTEKELQELTKINKYFQKKGLEYFTVELRTSMLAGYKDFPAIDDIQSLATKANSMLRENNYFIDA